MPQIGPLEILVVAVVALVVFGPERLPEMARKVGRFMTQVRRMADEVKDEFQTGLDEDEDEVEDEVEVEARDEETDEEAPEAPADHPVARAIASDNGKSAPEPSAPPLARLPEDDVATTDPSQGS